jgi:hypothetical protein
MMNHTQKKILVGAAALLTVMILFPPYNFIFQPPRETRFTKQTRPAGYHFLLSSNVPQDHSALAALFDLPPTLISRPSQFSMAIDSDRLWLQIGALVVIAGVLLFITKRSA